MISQLHKYKTKLLKQGFLDEKINIIASDKEFVYLGDNYFKDLLEDIISKHGASSLCLIKPPLNLIKWLTKRTGYTLLEPNDTESKTFLHDIPVLKNLSHVDEINSLISKRKGLIVEDYILSVGHITVEQAYINASSIYHSLYIKYLEFVLEKGFSSLEEREDFLKLKEFSELKEVKRSFLNGSSKEDVLKDMALAGLLTIEHSLVDSFFGNISAKFLDSILISATASSMDELESEIIEVDMKGELTTSIIASSELSAHRLIYQATNRLAILHGHPKFSVVMSMLCDKREKCQISDCHSLCDEVRYIEAIPVVSGEIGEGITKAIAKVVDSEVVLIYGHGLFCMSETVENAFYSLYSSEKKLRAKYFELLSDKWGV